MKSSPMAVKRMQAVAKNVPQRAVGRTMRTKHSHYIYRVVKQDGQEQELTISKDLMFSIASEAARLSLYNKRRTITKQEVENAMKHVLSRGHPSALEE